MKGLLIGGGQEYHGPTAARDKHVVELTAQRLFELVGNTIQIITGGMPGIPMDFAKAWQAAGGKHVLFVVSDEYLDTLKHIEMDVDYKRVGKTQADRRIALTQLPSLSAAWFVQGGQYTTDEIIRCQQRRLPTLCFVGSGGASSGAIPYKGQVPDLMAMPDWSRITAPTADAQELASLFAHEIKRCF